jgi:hypothetical protein
MNIYNDLAIARDNLRRTKDHEQTVRAIVEWVELTGKNADDRKRELAFLLSQDETWQDAQESVRMAEWNVDRAQAQIDQAEAEHRAREIKLRYEEVDTTRETNRLRAIELKGINQIKIDMDDLFKK